MEAGASPGTRIRSTRAGPFAATTGTTSAEARAGGENARGAANGSCPRAPESSPPIRSARATRATSQPHKNSTAKPTAMRIMLNIRPTPTKCDTAFPNSPPLPTEQIKVRPSPNRAKQGSPSPNRAKQGSLTQLQPSEARFSPTHGTRQKAGRFSSRSSTGKEGRPERTPVREDARRRQGEGIGEKRPAF